MHVKVKLGDLHPNPFKKEILGGKFEESKISKLRESIQMTGFWENVMLRKGVADEYQLVYGHHRVEAAIRELGPDYVVDLPLRKLNDSMMLQMMAMENSTNETEAVESQVAVIIFTRDWLKEHHEACRWTGRSPRDRPVKKRGNIGGNAVKQHEPGSVECISAFLGKENWSAAKIKNLCKLETDLAPGILKELKNRASKKGEVGQKAALAISKLKSKSAQKKAVDMLKAAPVPVPKGRIEVVMRELKTLPEEKQESAVKVKLGEVIDEIKQDKHEEKLFRESKVRDINAVAFSFLGSLRKVLNGDRLERMLNKFIECRQYLSESNKQGMSADLTDLAKRAMKLANRLVAPPPMAIGGATKGEDEQMLYDLQAG